MTPGSQPVSKQELREAEGRIVDRLTEVMRDMQSEILRGLQSFARGNFARLHTLESTQGDTNIRLAALEERVLNLETRRPLQ
jgi:hypothetical protein